MELSFKKWLGGTESCNAGDRPLSPLKCSSRSVHVADDDDEEDGDTIRPPLTHHKAIIMLHQVKPQRWELWSRPIQNQGSRCIHDPCVPGSWAHPAKFLVPTTRAPSSINTQWSCHSDAHMWGKNTLRKHTRGAFPQLQPLAHRSQAQSHPKASNPSPTGPARAKIESHPSSQACVLFDGLLAAIAGWFGD